MKRICNTETQSHFPNPENRKWMTRIPKTSETEVKSPKSGWNEHPFTMGRTTVHYGTIDSIGQHLVLRRQQKKAFFADIDAPICRSIQVEWPA